MRFGAEELFKEDRNDEESKKRLLNMNIDEILERAEKVEEKETSDEKALNLLRGFTVCLLSCRLDRVSFSTFCPL